MRRLLALLVALVFAVAGCSSADPSAEEAVFVEYAVGKRPATPAVSGELLDGGSFDLASLKGKVVVLNFWASWCAPCRVEADDLEKVYLDSKASGVEFVGINIRDEQDKAKAFLVGRATYPSIFDPAGRVGLGFAGLALSTPPSTLVIDRDGKIAVVIRTSIRAEDLQPIVTRVAGETPRG